MHCYCIIIEIFIVTNSEGIRFLYSIKHIQFKIYSQIYIPISNTHNLHMCELKNELKRWLKFSWYKINLININLNKYAMCKKAYPDLTNETREMLLLTSGIILVVTVLVQKSTYTTSHPCRFGPFVLRHDWATRGTKMHATHRSMRRTAAVAQKSVGRNLKQRKKYHNLKHNSNF